MRVHAYISSLISESLTGIEPVTFWLPVKCSNHLSYSTRTQCLLYRQSEGYRFDSRQGLIFLSLGLIRTRIQNYNIYITYKLQHSQIHVYCVRMIVYFILCHFILFHFTRSNGVNYKNLRGMYDVGEITSKIINIQLIQKSESSYCSWCVLYICLLGLG